MASYYPVYLDLREKPCVVIGGGEEAQHKVQGLLECGAQVTVISLDLTHGLHDLASRGLIQWRPREYQPGDLQPFFLAIACTTRDVGMNRAMAQEAERTRTLLNVVDGALPGAWMTPAVVRRGEVTVAISTEGVSLALAQRLREGMEQSPVLEWADMAELVSQVRLALRRRGVRPDPERWKECLDDRLFDLFHQGHHAADRELLIQRLLE